jgi:hypothetical protein
MTPFFAAKAVTFQKNRTAKKDVTLVLNEPPRQQFLFGQLHCAGIPAIVFFQGKRLVVNVL